MKKRLIAKLLVFGSLLAVGAWLFVKLIIETGVSEIWQAVSSVTLLSFLLFFGVSMINMAIYTWRWEIILRQHYSQTKVPFIKLMLHRISAYAVSYLTPAALTGGEPVRIYFLQKDGVPLEEATSATVIDKILELSVIFVVIIFAAMYAILDGSFPESTGTIIYGTFGVFFVLIAWFYYSTINDIGFISSVLRGTKLVNIPSVKKFEQKVVKIEKQMAKFYRGHMTKMSFLVLLALINVGILVFEHWLIARFLGVSLNFKESFLSTAIPEASYLIPIPGALGALEQSHTVIYSLLGVTINAFAMVLIFRIRDLLLVLIGLIHASGFGMQMLKDVFKKQ